MYLITAYFDESTNRQLQHLIDGIAECTGNSFMKDHNVPPHLTISAFETRNPNGLIHAMQQLRQCLNAGEVQLVSVGAFLPYVMYVTPVLDDYLHGMAVEVHDKICNCECSCRNAGSADGNGKADIQTYIKEINAQNVANESENNLENKPVDIDIRVSKYYHPSKWFPHITLGKTLGEDQLRQAFAYLQKHFVPFTGRIIEIGLAKTNPHEDIYRIDI